MRADRRQFALSTVQGRRVVLPHDRRPDYRGSGIDAQPGQIGRVATFSNGNASGPDLRRPLLFPLQADRIERANHTFSRRFRYRPLAHGAPARGCAARGASSTASSAELTGLPSAPTVDPFSQMSIHSAANKRLRPAPMRAARSRPSWTAR